MKSKCRDVMWAGEEMEWKGLTFVRVSM
jgi:hypothetical protein